MNLPKRSIVLWNLRSTYNVGAITRSAVSFNISDIICIGTTPYPSIENDSRLPHIAQRAAKQITKTALGAEQYARYIHLSSIEELVSLAQQQNICVLALEQSSNSIDITSFTSPDHWMLIVGEETKGLPDSLMNQVDTVLEINQPGPKNSLNVAAASAIALYALTGI